MNRVVHDNSEDDGDDHRRGNTHVAHEIAPQAKAHDGRDEIRHKTEQAETRRDKAGQSGTDAGQPPCLLGFFVAPTADGDQDFWLAFSPHSAMFEGGWTGFDPLENRV